MMLLLLKKTILKLFNSLLLSKCGPGLQATGCDPCSQDSERPVAETQVMAASSHLIRCDSFPLPA